MLNWATQVRLGASLSKKKVRLGAMHLASGFLQLDQPILSGLWMAHKGKDHFRLISNMSVHPIFVMDVAL